MPKAFIIMPFDPSMQEVYDGFIKPTLEEAGYIVARADNIQSVQNILDDIVRGIFEADLVVADLSSGNENVFYELGIAHALSKSTILLTDNLDDVPFDLRSYRMLGYNTHFAKIQDAKKQLADLARGAFEKTVPFSNPVESFFQKHPYGADLEKVHTPYAGASENPEYAQDDESEKKGLYDYLADVEESTEAITEFLNEAGNLLDAFTTEMSAATKNLSEDKLSLRKRREIVRELSKPTNNVYSFFKKSNPRIRTQLGSFETGLTFFLNTVKYNPEQFRSEEWDTFIAPMKSLKHSVSEGKIGMNELIMSMMQLPHVQSKFDHAKKGMTEELVALVESFGQLDSILTRAISFAENLRGKPPS